MSTKANTHWVRLTIESRKDCLRAVLGVAVGPLAAPHYHTETSILSLAFIDDTGKMPDGLGRLVDAWVLSNPTAQVVPPRAVPQIRVKKPEPEVRHLGYKASTKKPVAVRTRAVTNIAREGSTPRVAAFLDYAQPPFAQGTRVWLKREDRLADFMGEAALGVLKRQIKFGINYVVERCRPDDKHNVDDDLEPRWLCSLEGVKGKWFGTQLFRRVPFGD